MSFHKRKLIRDAALELLKTKVKNVTSFSKNRFIPFWDREKLPALNLYLISEDSEILDEGPRRFKRTLQIAVELIVEKKEDSIEMLDDSLDAYCLDIENALQIDETLNGTVDDCFLRGTEMLEKVEGEIEVASVVMAFEAKYYSTPDYEELRDFTGLDGNIVVGGEDTAKMPFEVNVEQ